MGTNERRERERRQRQGRILEAAREVFLARSIEAATMDEVAERAELSKGALYLYFASKEDLVTALLLAPLEELRESFEGELGTARAGVETVEQMLRLQVRTMQQHREIFRLVYASRCAHPSGPSGLTSVTLMQEQRARLLAMYAEAIARGQQDGSIRGGLEPAVVAVQMWASLIGLRVLSVHDDALGVSTDEAAASLIDLFGWALRAHPAPVTAAAAVAAPSTRSSRSRRSA